MLYTQSTDEMRDVPKRMNGWRFSLGWIFNQALLFSVYVTSSICFLVYLYCGITSMPHRVVYQKRYKCFILSYNAAFFWLYSMFASIFSWIDESMLYFSSSCSFCCFPNLHSSQYITLWLSLISARYYETYSTRLNH